jgi:hypothetical protein
VHRHGIAPVPTAIEEGREGPGQLPSVGVEPSGRG